MIVYLLDKLAFLCCSSSIYVKYLLNVAEYHVLFVLYKLTLVAFWKIGL